MRGFRGRFSTKSRSYSTTLGTLRQVRADYRANQQRALTFEELPLDEIPRLGCALGVLSVWRQREPRRQWRSRTGC
ncbi:hypothetical protein GCM10009864_20070 [Streptomyces lunalinharesii]|uniref:Transposase n=1 Tax=Streptomyces lunalinharesii TaxID=333384 RepID=A0ABN3RL33_9ACTN